MSQRENAFPADGAFTAVADFAPGMMWMAEPDGSRTFFNRPWLAFTGRTLNQESGAGWMHSVHADDRARCVEEYGAAVRSGRPFELEYRLRRGDGEFRHVLDRAAPHIEDGALIGYIGSCLDIEDRKAGETALRASETLFRLLAENAGDVIYRHRVYPTVRTEYISPASLAVCGRGPEEFIANPDLGFQLVHPDDREIAMSMRHDADNARKLTVLRWIHADGHVVWTEHRGTPIFDDDGRLVAVEGIVRDITERVLAEQRLAKSESLFRLLAENASDLIYRYAVSPLRCEYMSPSSARVLGFAPQDFYADHDLPLKLLHPQDQWALDRIRENPHEMIGPVVLRWRHHNGGIVYVEHQNTPAYDARGELIAIEGIGRDVTHRRTIEIRLRRSQSQLRRLAASVEQARENERTQIARELHDELGQSLTAIKLELARMSRAFANEGLAPKEIDILQSIVGTVDVAIETVRRLATSLRPSALDDLGLVGAIELEASALARRTGIRCQLGGNRRIPPLHPDQITGVFRIVQEALTNVVRHASASSVRISIDGTATAMAVKVRDNGRGMNLDETVDRPALGLLGMRERAEMIGARLAVTSAPGKGTCVSIALSRRPRQRKEAS